MNSSSNYPAQWYRFLAIWGITAAVAFIADHRFPQFAQLSPGRGLLELLGMFAVIMASADLLSLITQWWLIHRNKPPVEGLMLSRLYRLVAALTVLISLVYGLGKLKTFGTLFSLFGGMLLGWSLQAPVSGFAAWILVTVKRPFRLNDRIMFPSLGLIGDVGNIGPMYTVLNQVGGSVGSEEAVGRSILIPNAMLFSQVIINYTVRQEAAYFLDEVVIRITYDSDWQKAEEILLNAANETSADIIEETGMEPYIRSEIYDYGVLMRVRYQTRAQERPLIAHEIIKRVFNAFQMTPQVDFAIPYVYSSRRGAGMKQGEAEARNERDMEEMKEIPIDKIHMDGVPEDAEGIERVMQSISHHGLLQPIIAVKHPTEDYYDLLVGHQRLEACRRLGWKTIPAMMPELCPMNTPASLNREGYPRATSKDLQKWGGKI